MTEIGLNKTENIEVMHFVGVFKLLTAIVGQISIVLLLFSLKEDFDSFLSQERLVMIISLPIGWQLARALPVYRGKQVQIGL